MSETSSTSRPTGVLVVGDEPWVDPFVDTLASRVGTAVRSVRTGADCLEVVHDGPQRANGPDGSHGTDGEAGYDAVVTASDLPDVSGVDLVRELRASRSAIAVVLATASGDESVASAAIGAGVSEYVVMEDGCEAVDELVDRTVRAVRTARRERTQRDRASQFDAIFHDTRTATWVLDPAGSTTRLNRTARELVDPPVADLVGTPFWALPCWGGSDGVQDDVRRIVDTAIGGAFGNAVVTLSGDSDPGMVELSARPVHNERGDLLSIVVEGVDISERVDLERDLRQSEELHRVTLNNMTDTVLITDEEGEYTYVCPNVHFIFGYTAAEIRDLGTVEELLGDDLFERERLAEEGVLKNIECTATDKAGREHTLLVNVREVSIQDGTVLYSCRDVTKRKQREEALATLQETARDFLYAETHREIAQHVVDDTSSVLGFDASAVYLFDPDANDLQPAAVSRTMREVNGPLPTVHAGGRRLPSFSFVEGEPLFFDDVHDDDRLVNRATDLRSTAYIPLGNHGVYVAGSTRVGAFDDVTRELADLLAATAEAAFDRVTRESRLRDQERELQQQNEQLSALNRINETIRGIDQTLVQAETREEIDHTVCELLASDDRFAFAWIGDPDSRTGTVTPRAWAGAEQGYLDSLEFPVEAASVDPTGRSAASGEMEIVETVPDGLREEAWRKEALSRDYLSVVSIPLVYNEITYGVLSVYAESQDAFDATAQEVLAELGETIASAISGIERKNALLTTSVTRVEYGIDDPTFVLTRLARDADCTVSYQGGAQQTAEGSYVFVTVDDAQVGRVEAAARELVAIDGVQRMNADGTGGVLRLRLAQPFLAQELADHGAVFRSASATPTETSLVVDVPESVSVRRVTRLVEDAFSTVDLRSKQTRDQAGDHDLYSTFFDRLTDRQLEVLQTAYYSGFFESPRDHTGEEVAAMLDISPTAFYKHARTVQRKLFATLLEEQGSTPAGR